MQADEKLTAFVEPESTIGSGGEDQGTYACPLSPEICPKLKHRWSKFEAHGPINEANIRFTGNSRFGD